MAHKIDGQMLHIYQQSAKRSGDDGQISEQDTRRLIEHADKMNGTTSSSWGKSKREGDKALDKLVKDNESHFSSESQNMIKYYLYYGRMPAGVDSQNYTNNNYSTPTAGRPGFHQPTPNSPMNENSGLPQSNDFPSPDMGRPSSGRDINDNPSNNHVIDNNSGSPHNNHTNNPTDASNNAPTNNAADPSNSAPANTNPNAPNVPNNETRPVEDNPNTDPINTNPINEDNAPVGPHGKLVLDFNSAKKTWGCHWFPMQETQPGGDRINNLYAKDGPLDKLDRVTGKKARQYEFDNNRKPYDSGSEYSWWGHCNNASEAACILREPKHGVDQKAPDGTTVHFTKNDIEGLLVKITPSLITRVSFRGDRFNNPSIDDPDNPKPEVFLKVLKDWSKDDKPFIMDIDRDRQVWNYPYDKAKIYETNTPPSGFDATNLPDDGSVKYYRCEMSGTGYKEEQRTYAFFIQRGENGEAINSGWIKTPETDYNPDFLWRPHPRGDLYDKATWKLMRGKSSNPEVDPQVIYDIYMKSLS